MVKQTITEILPDDSFKGNDGNPVTFTPVKFADGSEGKAYSKPIREALAALVGKEQEFELQDKGEYKGVKQWQIKGIPGVVEANRFAGKKGGWNRDPFLEESLKAPGFALSYAKDLAVAGYLDVEAIVAQAKTFLDFLRTEQSKVKSSVPPPDRGVTAPSESSPVQRESDGRTLSSRPALVALHDKLIASGKSEKIATAFIQSVPSRFGKKSIDEITDEEVEQVTEQVR